MKKKLLLFLLLISFVPLLLVSIVSSYLFNSNAKADYLVSSHSQVEQLKFEIQGIMTKHLDLLKLLATIPAIQSYDVLHAKTPLVEASHTYPMLVPIVVDMNTGRQIVKSDESALAPNISDRKFFQLAMKGQSDVISDILISKDNNHLIIVLATPIRSEDKSTITGVLQGTIDLDMMIQFVSERSKDGIISYIVDREGKIIAHPQRELVEKHTDLSKLDFIQKSLQGGNGTVEIKDEQGILKIVNYTYDSTTGWVIVQEIPYSILAEKSHKMLLTNGIIIAVTMLIVLLLGYMMANKITRPVQVILEECMLLAQGDLRSRTMKVVSNDEMGQLAEGFSTMRSKLQDLILSIKSEAEYVASSSEQLTASAQQSAEASNQVAGSISEIAIGVDKQVCSAEQMVIVTEQLSVSTEQVVKNTQDLSHTANTTSQDAQRGKLALEQAVMQMKDISKGSEAIQIAVAHLATGTQEINEIANLISAISGQTNLLALNAAIEAARAGEHGRGFAVVAEEVRKLAEASNKAALQIGELIQKNQTNMNQAITVTQTGMDGIKAGMTTVNVAGETFGNIVESIMVLSNQINQISLSIKQISSNGQSLLASAQEINKISKENAGETQTISAATEEQSASMQEIAASSRELSNLAHNLENAVTKFQI